MDLSHMRTMYDTGRLSEAMIIASHEDNSWLVDCHDLWGHTLHLTNHSGDALHYDTVDNATKAARAIGFNQVGVIENVEH